MRAVVSCVVSATKIVCGRFAWWGPRSVWAVVCVCVRAFVVLAQRAEAIGCSVAWSGLAPVRLCGLFTLIALAASEAHVSDMWPLC